MSAGGDPAVVLSVQSTVGPDLIGAFIGAMCVSSFYGPSEKACRADNVFLLFSMYGILCLQTMVYFRTYPNDRLFLKLTVRLQTLSRNISAYISSAQVVVIL